MKLKLLLLGCLAAWASYAQTTPYEYTKGQHQKQIIGYFTQWDAWKGAEQGVAKGFFNQLNLDYSQYTILNWSFFGLAEDGSLHSADYRNKQIHQSGQVQAPAAVFNTDIYSSWDLWLFEGELEVLHYLPDDLDQNTTHELHWAFSEHGYKGNGSGWVHTDGRTGDYPLPLPKPNGAKGLIELAQNHGVKVMASIGGWSMSKHFPEMAADPVKRAKFVTACQNLIQKYGFDGIDLDWEFPGPFSGMNFTGSQADYANFTTLIAELRQGIGPDKLITAAFNASPTKLAGFDWNALSTTMDYFNMMSYDMHGGWSNKAGHNSPLYPYTGEEDYGASWDNTFQYLVSQGVAPAQINMGVGFYGRGVVTDGAATLNAPTVKVSKNISPDGTVMTASDYTNWGAYDGTPNFDYIMDNNSGWQQHWDNEAKVPYMTKDNYFLSYDNTQSITEKAQYVNSNQIGGVIVWQVFGDWDAGAITTTYANKLPYAPATKAPLVNVLNKVFAENTSLPNQAPVITMQQPTDGAQLEQADFEDIRLEVQITDTDGSVSSRDFTLNGNVVSFTQNGNTYVFDYTTSAYGANTLQVSATDNEGAQTQKEFTFSIVAPQNQGPSISFVSPTAGQSISQSDFEMVPITVTIADEDGSIANTDFNINGETVSFSNTGDSYTFDFLPSSYGTVNLEVAATDEAGETTSATLTFEIKTPNTGGPFSELLTEASFNQLFPHRFGVGSNNQGSIDFYSYENLRTALDRMANIEVLFERRCATNLYRLTRKDKSTGATVVIRNDAGFDGSAAAIIKTTVDYGAFANAGDLEKRQRELMAFLANISQETTGGWPTAPDGQYAYGLYFNEEQGYAGTSNLGYRDEGHAIYPPVAGKSYHGRGPIQLSWNYNYGQVSAFLYGDKEVLLQNPERVIEDGALAFQTAIWFWMTPQYPKPSAHDVMVGNWQPTQAQRDAGLIPGLGATVNIINGGIECNSGTENPKVVGRINHYKRYTDIVGIGPALDGSDNPVELGCAHMPAFQIDSQECNVITGIVFTSPKDGEILALNPGEATPIVLGVSDPLNSLSNIRIEFDGQTINGTTASWVPSAFGDYTLTARAQDGGETLVTVARVTIIDASTATGCEGISDWSTTQVYAEAGQKVVYQGKLYHNKWWTQGDVPADTDVWEYVKDCGSGPTNTAPVISGVVPTDGSAFTQAQFENIGISFSVSDAEGNLQSVSAAVDGISLTLSQTGNGYTASYLPSAYGNHTLQITAADGAGLSSSSQFVFMVNQPQTNTAPEISEVSPANGAELPMAQLSELTIEAQITDAQSKLETVRFLVDGTTVTHQVNGNNYTVAFTPTAFKTYGLTIEATDGEGAQTVYTGNFMVAEVDDTCNTPNWSAQVYSSTGTKVFYDGRLFENQWYAEATDVPGTASVWKFLEYCGDGPNLEASCGYEVWNEAQTYATGGAEVFYQQKIYRSKWWVKGETPDTSAAWEYVKECVAQGAKAATSTAVLYPNPATTVINVQVEKPVLGIRIFDMAGILLLETNALEVNIGHMAKGPKIMQIAYTDGTNESKQFIKE